MFKTQVVIPATFIVPIQTPLHTAISNPNLSQVHLLNIVLHKSGLYKHAINKLIAMQCLCSDLGIDDTSLRCSLFSLLVQPVLWVWRAGFGSMQLAESACLLFIIYVTNLDMANEHLLKLSCVIRHLCISFGVSCFEICRGSSWPGIRLVKKAFMQAQHFCTPWFPKLSSWLHDHMVLPCVHSLKGFLSAGTFSFSTALISPRLDA